MTTESPIENQDAIYWLLWGALTLLTFLKEYSSLPAMFVVLSSIFVVFFHVSKRFLGTQKIENNSGISRCQRTMNSFRRTPGSGRINPNTPTPLQKMEDCCFEYKSSMNLSKYDLKKLTKLQN
ncbi:hypothetical protein FKM82_008721 [Ascaphus truei]